MDIIASIKATYTEILSQRHVIIIEEIPNGGWRIHDWTPDGVAPPSHYETRRLAAARVLQLLHVGPVAPQAHPEEVCIGHIVSEPTE